MVEYKTMSHKNLPILALIGRPNVGKSALFNRLVGCRQAIVEDIPGVTRDRNYGESDWNGRSFTVIDTGGFIPGSMDEIEAEVRDQAEFAIREADVILFIVDGKVGFMDRDIEVANLLRKHNKPLLLVVNKIDNTTDYSSWTEFYKLGLGDPHPISSLHGNGLGDVLDEAVKLFPPQDEENEINPAARIAIVGRPNVGKSSLLNELLGQRRSIVSDQSGTTRDSIDTVIVRNGKEYILIDTAGIRKKSRVNENVEYYSVNRALHAIRRSDVAILVVDAQEGITSQDAKLAGYIAQEGTSCILVINKWDLIEEKVDDYLARFKKREEDPNFPSDDEDELFEDGKPKKIPFKKFKKEKKPKVYVDQSMLFESMLPQDRGANIHLAMREYQKHVEKNLYFMTWVPVLYTSATQGKRVERIFEYVDQVMEARHSRVSTGELNRFLEGAIEHWQPPEIHGKEVKVYYMTQTDTAPPHFTLFVNLKDSIPSDYTRYLMNCIRKAFGFIGCPVTLNIRSKKKLKPRS